MDVNEYLPMFLAECREHLQDLNLAIVALEQTPDDRERVDEVFRIAHSIKAMSATMGFEGMAELTHEMENVFELLRERAGGLDRAAIDATLECLDALSAATDAIEEDGDERIDPAPLVKRLRALVRASTPEPAPPPLQVVPDADAVHEGVTISISLRDDVAMPAVRAYMVVAALAEHGEVLRSEPAEADMDDFTGREIEVVLRTDHEESTLVKAARDVEGVAQVTVMVSGRSSAERPSSTPNVDLGVPAEPDRSAAPSAPEAATERKAPRKATSTVRVDADRLDQLMGVMGELVVHRTQLEALVAQSDVPGIAQAMQELNRSSQALRAMVMQVRMIEVEAVFLRLPRLVRDLSAKLGKAVDLRLSGAETELDRTVVDALGDPLVHLVRNALDHGFEPAEDRVAAGKPASGTLEISARHAGSSVVIEVRDDGRGIDPAAVARKAVQRGLLSGGEDIDMAAAIELLFSPGFSTAEQMSDVSGRGVGMDAVRSTVQSLGGEVTLSSVSGHGTTAQIRLPLTLAIMAALLVEVGDLPFAIPLDRVERTLRLEDHPVRSAAGRRLLVMRDGLLPLCDGAVAFGREGFGGENVHAVVVRAGEQRIALAVEHLIGQRELVTRPLPQELCATTAVSGGAVLSDGGIALIVDCDSLIGKTTRQLASTLARA